MARRKWIGKALRATAALLILYLVAGYTAPRVTWLTVASPAVDVEGASALPPGPPDRASGALAVHTHRSHDAIGWEPEVLEAARAAGLDFVILTDHRSGSAPDSLWEVAARFGESVLLVRGQEISLGGEVGRVLTFGLDTVVTRWTGELSELERALERDSATAIVAHSRSPRVRDSWRPARTPGIVGWEVFDLADVGRERLAGPWVIYHLLALGASAPIGRSHLSLIRLFREGFDQPAVAAFDSLYQRGDLTALAGLDAHPKVRILGGLVPGYETFFKTMVNHVVLDGPLPDDPNEATARLADGVEAGRVYISFGDTEPARAFHFRVGGEEYGSVGVGASAEWKPGLRLEAGFGSAGQDLRLLYRVIRDGKGVAWYRGPRLRWQLPGVGAYRVEVYRYSARIGPFFWNLRPWIFSNPIRVVHTAVGSAAGSRHPASEGLRARLRPRRNP